MPTSPSIDAMASDLVECLGAYESLVVAFSAGVDSAVVAKAAQLALGDRAVAVTGVGPALAEGELKEARRVAALIGIRHIEVATDEIHNDAYTSNAPDRCYHCKTELYSHLHRIAKELGFARIANGANADDTGDHRPGMRAAEEHRVVSPLLEAGIDKRAVRQLAKSWDMPLWDKPATPCLASRVAYGEEVTPERLARIDAAERLLRKRGLREVRVRLHPGELARIEVPVEWIPRLAEETVRLELIAQFRELGFKGLSLDMAGFRSGSLNELVSPESLRLAR